MSYTVYLDMIWGQSVGFKQRRRRWLTERLHYLKWLFVFNFTFQLISSGSGHREVITDADEPAGPERGSVCVCVCVECFIYHIIESRHVYVWEHTACMESCTSAPCVSVVVCIYTVCCVSKDIKGGFQRLGIAFTLRCARKEVKIEAAEAQIVWAPGSYVSHNATVIRPLLPGKMPSLSNFTPSVCNTGFLKLLRSRTNDNKDKQTDLHV